MTSSSRTDIKEIKAQIIRAAEVPNDPWYLAKIAQAQDGSYYAKIAAQDASANGVYKWNAKTGEESRLNFYHFSDFPKGAITLWESRSYINPLDNRI